LRAAAAREAEDSGAPAASGADDASGASASASASAAATSDVASLLPASPDQQPTPPVTGRRAPPPTPPADADTTPRP
jgi:hypothetical protein